MNKNELLNKQDRLLEELVDINTNIFRLEDIVNYTKAKDIINTLTLEEAVEQIKIQYKWLTENYFISKDKDFEIDLEYFICFTDEIIYLEDYNNYELAQELEIKLANKLKIFQRSIPKYYIDFYKEEMLKDIKYKNKIKEEISEVKKELEIYQNIYLHELLNQSLEELRLEVYKYKRRPFVWNKLDIKFDWLEPEVAGKILIESNTIIINRSSYTYNNTFDSSNRNKKQREINKQIKDIIKHEILHSYTSYFTELYDNKMIYHLDSSIIFMSLLAWFNIRSGHPAYEKFKESEDYNKVKSFNSFSNLMIYLRRLMHRYNRLYEEILYYNYDFIKGTKKEINLINFTTGEYINKPIIRKTYNDKEMIFRTLTIPPVFNINDIDRLESDIKELIDNQEVKSI